MKIKRALLSCTDKTGLVDFAKFLASKNIEMISTGGTAKLLKDNQIPVKEISEFTGFPEIMDGRVKTLHPKVHGGLLAVRDNKNHQNALKENQIQEIDLLVVNLYAFEKTVADPHCSFENAIENIDIGGPSMLRSAAKNHKYVTVVVDPEDYARVQNAIAKNSLNDDLRFELALKAFQTTARYDTAISTYLSHKELPLLSFSFQKIQDLRYGENPHQQAAFYKYADPHLAKGLVQAKQLHGKELSFNNILDTESAYRCCQDFSEPTCVIVKHGNPCGTASSPNLYEAFLRARAGDPVSSFGGVVVCNRPLDKQTALNMAETFFEVILAPTFANEALEILKKKKNLRLLTLDSFQNKISGQEIRCVSGGVLVQDFDTKLINPKECDVVTKRKPTEMEWIDLEFAWRVVKHVKSNAIVLAKDKQSLGVGAGQMSRVDSVKIAASKAEEFFSKQALSKAVMASDAFFPFRDGIDVAAPFGIKAIVQPGGSVRDQEVIEACDENNITMVFTKTRHFRH